VIFAGTRDRQAHGPGPRVAHADRPEVYEGAMRTRPNEVEESRMKCRPAAQDGEAMRVEDRRKKRASDEELGPGKSKK